jgi:intracellular sulfur oxidation DsrE/DsrF family protein
MHNINELDDQVLEAFVDAQLDAQTCEIIINEMHNNPQIREHVYRLRRSKDLLKLGFATATAPSEKQKRNADSFWQPYSLTMVACVAALFISVSSAVLGYYFARQATPNINNMAQLQTSESTQRILLHISDADKKHFSAALSYAENFLTKHESSGGQIAVVANAGGLDLMRSGVSPYEKQIIQMMKAHDNVYFIACANSIRALRDKGIKFKLINHVQVDKPAMDQIIEYVKDGWTYKKVNSSFKI